MELTSSNDLGQHLQDPKVKDNGVLTSLVLSAARKFLLGQGFVECLPPVIGPVTDPGGRGSKPAEVDYYGASYRLMSSVILYKQASLISHDKVFFIAPNVRLESPDKSATGRHLAEFHQLDVEFRSSDVSEAMRLCEDLVRFVLAQIPVEVTPVRRRNADVGERSWDRITHGALAGRLESWHTRDASSEIPWHVEKEFSASRDEPCFVIDFPVGSRGFYDAEQPPVGVQGSSLLHSFDAIMPFGFGELASGAAREHRYEVIVRRMLEMGEDPERYSWFLNLARDGLLQPSAGFGIGIERLVRFLADDEDIRKCSLFPKTPGELAP